jgi:hypothetical protein
LSFVLALGACATSGPGSNPPLSGGTFGAAGDDTGPAVDDGGAATDDASSGDDAAAPPSGDDASADTCNDGLHGLAALFVIPPVPCSTSTDCKSGQCCFVGPTSSTCVMQ